MIAKASCTLACELAGAGCEGLTRGTTRKIARHTASPPPSAQRQRLLIVADTFSSAIELILRQRASVLVANHASGSGRADSPSKRHRGSLASHCGSRGSGFAEFAFISNQTRDAALSCALFCRHIIPPRSPYNLLAPLEAFPGPGRAATSSPGRSFSRFPQSVRRKIHHSGAAQLPVVAAQAVR